MARVGGRAGTSSLRVQMGESMRQYIPVITLALLSAFALAVVSGGLLPSDSVVQAQAANTPPVFGSVDTTPDVDENTPPGTNIGDPYTATDVDEDTLEFGDPLTYSLEGDDEASFDIDSSTGQLITKAALHADGDNQKLSYSVTVRVEDSRGGTGERSVTISVTNVDEPPAAPMAPTVVSGEDDTGTTDVDESTTTLKVIWHEPENMGGPINDYDVEYKKTIDTSFVIDNITHSDTDTVATITDLEAATSYQVRVRAKNGEADDTENWSLTGTGLTNKTGNGAPSFDENGVGDEETLTRPVDENEPPREEIGTEVRANAHVDDSALTYRLGGRDADLFEIDMSSGQLRTKGSMNHEDPRCYVENNVDDPADTNCDYYVTVSVFDGQGASDARPVKIEIRDRSEAPDTPARPTVRATEKSSRSLDVSWTAPRNPGPPITGYEIRYRKGTSSSYSTIPEGDISGTSHTIAPEDIANNEDVDERLSQNTSYEVHVKAKTLERDSAWSALTTGRTSAGNQDAIFDNRPDNEAAKTDRTIERTVNENTRAGQSVGSTIRARDRDSLTYKLVAADAPNADDFEKFDINKSTGQILTKAPLNHEDTDCGYVANNEPSNTTCFYTVKVQVRDGKDEHGNKEADDAPEVDTLDDEITVQINVRDVNEVPAAPKVTVTSPMVADGATAASLVVTWNRPDNTGPAITEYVVECSGSGITVNSPCPQPTIASPNNEGDHTYTIDTLLVQNSSYRVRVRARNDEGLGAWSTQVTQSTSEAGNTIPTITAPQDPLTVAEDVRSGSNVGDNPVEADDGTESLTVSYRIEGPNDDLFRVDNIGQIKTRRALNHEDPRCYNVSNPNDTVCEYTVRLKVWDGDNGSFYRDITIRVTDEEEPPSAPGGLRVIATADTGRSLEVTWNEPANAGPPVVDYEIRYRKYVQGSNSAEYEEWPHATTERKATITTILDVNLRAMPLEPRKQYEVRVRARNGEGTAAQGETDAWGDYSSLVRGTTGGSNVRPAFSNTDSLITLDLPENTRAGQNVGSAVEATDADRGNRLTYTLEGPGKDSFTITSAGQIRTRSGVTYDYETRQGYSVTVKVDDGQRKDNSVATKSVTIDVEDRDEPPSTPSAPSVMAISGSTDSVRVTWEEPNNTGPPITDYDVQCPNCPVSISHDGVDRSMIITGLTPGTRYNVQVRARNDEGHSDWSSAGGGSPNADVSNQRPIFSGGARTFSVEENSVVAGDPIGNPVTAVDPDLDTVTHTLEGTDATSFSIDAGSGQIRATGELDHEEKSRYSVTVKATDTRGGSATVGVTINVTDVSEPPARPEAPTVTPASSTSILVSWDAPENTGPSITDYDYRYREALDSWTEVSNTTITATAVVIPGLTPGTSYDVDVRATNAEGTSDWSNSGIGSTTARGANSPPVFTEGTSATRSVSASAPAGTLIGAPVTATDADAGATLTYSLEGNDAASFDINDTSGQLLTKAGITLIVDETYTLTVAADDGSDIARISVSINATAAPPNNPPVFREGASAARTVSATAPAGTSIGAPLTATDADAGATLAYSLEGADAASFGINPVNGQLLTLAGVTLDRSTYIVDVVASDGSATSRITVTITVTPNRAPVFSEGGTATRSVREDAASGTAIGSPVTATDADPGTTLAYRLEGTDTSSFRINAANGQLLTSASLDAGTKATYTVDVVASDGSAEARITVTITVTALPTSFGCATRGAVSDASNTGLVSDCEALLDARDVLVGLGGPLNWSASTPIAQWDGVTVSETPMRVTKLDLRRSRLKGMISSDLSRVTALKELYLQDNHLTGPMPSELGSMTALTHLYAGNNDLSGAIPSQMGSMTELTELRLRSNDLSGPLPAALGSLTNLTYLLLSDNDLSGSIPSQIGDMSSLYWLDVGQNNISGTLPAELGNLSQLGRLYVYENDLTGSIPSTLGNLTGLTHIVAQENDLSGSIPVQLGNMSALVWMGLYDNDLSGAIPTQLSRLSNLQWLYLSNNDLTGTIPRELGQLSALTNLWLDGNGLSGTIPSELDQLTNLVRWRMRGNDFTGCVPADLAAIRDSDFDELGLPVCSGS